MFTNEEKKKTIKIRKVKKRERGIPYLYKNRVYFEKKIQKESGAISKVIAHLLENIGDVIGL